MLPEEKVNEMYNAILSYKIAFSPKLPSREEFLALSLNRESESITSFDEKTDAYLELQAIKRLEERRQLSGQ